MCSSYIVRYHFFLKPQFLSRTNADGSGCNIYYMETQFVGNPTNCTRIRMLLMYLFAHSDNTDNLYFRATDHTRDCRNSEITVVTTVSGIYFTPYKSYPLLFGMRLLFMHHAVIIEPPLDNRQSCLSNMLTIPYRRWILTLVWFALTSRALLCTVVVCWGCCWCAALVH